MYLFTQVAAQFVTDFISPIVQNANSSDPDQTDLLSCKQWRSWSDHTIVHTVIFALFGQFHSQCGRDCKQWRPRSDWSMDDEGTIMKYEMGIWDTFFSSFFSNLIGKETTYQVLIAYIISWWSVKFVQWTVKWFYVMPGDALMQSWLSTSCTCTVYLKNCTTCISHMK